MCLLMAYFFLLPSLGRVWRNYYLCSVNLEAGQILKIEILHNFIRYYYEQAL